MHAFHLLLRGCQRFRVHVLGGTRSDAAPLHTSARQIRAASRRRLFDQDEATDSREVDGGVLGQGGGPGRPVTGHLPSGAPQRAGRNPAVAPSVHRKRTSTKQQQKQQQKQQPAPADAADSPAGEGSGDVRPVAAGQTKPLHNGARRRQGPQHSSEDTAAAAAAAAAAAVAAAAASGFPPGIGTGTAADTAPRDDVRAAAGAADAGSGAAAALSQPAAPAPAQARGAREASLSAAGPAAAAGPPAPHSRPGPAAPQSPQSVRPGPGPGPALAPAASVYVFWDLDNKYPETLDHAGMLGRLRDMLQQYGRVVEIRAYGNHRTFKFVPEVWEAAMRHGVMKHPLRGSPTAGGGPSSSSSSSLSASSSAGSSSSSEGLRCPLCSRRVRGGESQLRSHFRQMHQREHVKKLARMGAAERAEYVQSRKSERRVRACLKSVSVRRHGLFGSENAVTTLAGILRRLGGDCVGRFPGQAERRMWVLQREAVELLEGAGKGADRRWGARRSGKRRRREKPPSVFVLMSDDHGFEMLLKLFTMAGWRALVVSNTRFRNADERLPWSNVLPPPLPPPPLPPLPPPPPLLQRDADARGPSRTGAGGMVRDGCSWTLMRRLLNSRVTPQKTRTTPEPVAEGDHGVE
ncbi:hypothetical protein PLESTB_000778600 [Pleodorina starrii]|uniref:C2H2-type domain-containing protein n=1 Tax=Pleodorina starrii TaxID=330485 RepID=A0A9W6BLE7_9CHLO|nr:hypothetical protein PLESTB_000778600 [Pleodorina starrii]